jgi:hypothetical protein
MSHSVILSPPLGRRSYGGSAHSRISRAKELRPYYAFSARCDRSVRASNILELITNGVFDRLPVQADPSSQAAWPHRTISLPVRLRGLSSARYNGAADGANAHVRGSREEYWHTPMRLPALSLVWSYHSLCGPLTETTNTAPSPADRGHGHIPSARAKLGWTARRPMTPQQKRGLDSPERRVGEPRGSPS